MGLKGYIRERLIAAVQYAVREEMKNYHSTPQDNSFEINEHELEERIVARLDKQIEWWTWERFKRTDKLFEQMDYELDRDLTRGVDNIEKRINVVNKKNQDIINATIDEKTKYWTARRFDQTDKQIERWTWERYKRAEDKLLYIYKIENELSRLLFEQNRVPYHLGEKVRIVFLFQVASFWPSWESFYQSCLQDERIESQFVFLDEHGRESVQMNTAHDFLESSGIDYLPLDEFDIDAFNPHVIIIQTPYDAGHRSKAHWSSAWKAKGYRVVYIPYGIEISDTVTSRGMHFEQHVIQNAWRIFTFNERMLKDYRKYCVNAEAVRACGLPKFDSFFKKESFMLDEELLSRINGRKICLWKVHFPKIFEEGGKDIIVTPDVNEYIKFAEYASSRSDLFFIFMPHPRFREPVKNKTLQQLATKLFEKLTEIENVYIDEQDDYRYSLMNADFIIVDRSAVMVEAAAVKVPVLYMINKTYEEPVTKGIEPIIESYYKGTTCDEMIEFVNNCMEGIDEKKEIRKQAFEECYPFFDGNSGERLKEEIINSLMEENNEKGNKTV